MLPVRGNLSKHYGSLSRSLTKLFAVRDFFPLFPFDYHLHLPWIIIKMPTNVYAFLTILGTTVE